MSDSSDSMTGTTAVQAQVLAGHGRFLIAAAARAPSVHNTQPWRFRVSPDAVELWTDPRRKLRVDPSGREMLISCGAALFGLRLAIRSLGYLPVTELLPDPAQLRLMARVRAGAAAPASGLERQLLDAVPRRHTHRGPFAPGPLPPGLLAGLQHDALAEGATLALVTGGLAYDRLERITAAAARRGDLSPRARAEIRRWTRTAAGMAGDGIPATALASRAGRPAGRLPQRDFDLGRGIARLPSGGAPPSATAVLLTPGDRRADWLRAGQALYRLLLHAAGQRVFASLHTQPLEDTATRGLISSQLALPGHPQMLLQLGLATAASPTARRLSLGGRQLRASGQRVDQRAQVHPVAADPPRSDLDDLSRGGGPAAVGIDPQPARDQRPALDLDRPARPGHRVDRISGERDDRPIKCPLGQRVMPQAHGQPAPVQVVLDGQDHRQRADRQRQPAHRNRREQVPALPLGERIIMRGHAWGIYKPGRTRPRDSSPSRRRPTARHLVRPGLQGSWSRRTWYAPGG